MWNRKAALEMVRGFINWMPLPNFGEGPLQPPLTKDNAAS